MAVEETIHVGELQAALNKAGASDIQIPAAWEGVQLRANIGPMVNLSYPDEVGILEAKPIEISVPARFPLQVFRGGSLPECRPLGSGGEIACATLHSQSRMDAGHSR
jgi:hypothetical protein